MEDARAAHAALATRVVASRIVIFGESLGTTAALMLAAERQVAAVMLDSRFVSAQAVARSACPWVPVRWLMRDTYRYDLVAPRVSAPMLQLPCRDDPVTPIVLAERLNALLPRAQPMERVERIDGRCHPVPFARFAGALQRFARAAVPRRAAPARAGSCRTFAMLEPSSWR